MRVHLLTTRRTRRACAFTFPLRVFGRRLKHAGIDVRLFFRHDAPRLTDCDVLGVVSDYFGIKHLIARPDEVVQLLEGYRTRGGPLVWFDVTDGTGTVFEPAFAVVDLYAKKQLLKDRRLYRAAYLEREYHLDYYYRHYGDELSELGEKARIVNHRGLEDGEIDKLRLSWNIGLGDYTTFPGGRRWGRAYWPLARFASIEQDAADPGRPVALSYRVGTRYQFPAVPFHRLTLRRLLTELAQEHTGYTVYLEGKLPYTAYMKELRRTRIAPSPFGWGEICWRDFEVLLCGAMLLKPDMEHLQTWPAYFEKDITYSAFHWDFADLKAQLAELLSDPARCRAIAQAGQQRYLDSLSPQGADAFVQRVADCVSQAQHLGSSIG